MKLILRPLLAGALVFSTWSAVAQGPTPTIRPAEASVITKGMLVQLSEGTPLRFEERDFRPARHTEEFVVLEARSAQGLVYLSAVDKSGTEIAVTASLGAATRLERSPERDAEELAKAIDNHQYAAALALSSEWTGDVAKRTALADMITRIRIAEASLLRAKNGLAAAEADAKRTLRHAELTEGRGDNPPFARAAASLKRQAEESVNKAQAGLKLATTEREKFMTAFSELVGEKSESVPAGAGVPSKRPGIEGEFLRDDPASVPEGLANSGISPSFEETLAFINERIAPLHLWLGGKSGKLNLTQAINARRIVQFDPADMSSDVKLVTKTFGRYTEFTLQISPATSKPKPKVISRDRAPAVSQTDQVQFFARDAVDQEKLAKAVRHLLEMLGAQKDPF